MRFDDSLDTVLAADISTPFGAQSAWRQLVDLIGRRRAIASVAALRRLAELRPKVPIEVRAASARGLAFADPPEPLVRFFAEDTFAVAAPVLRVARLPSAEWVTMLPALSPQTRSVLRHRRDLATEVGHALAAFGPADFVLGSGEMVEARLAPAALPEPPSDTPLSETSFKPLGDVARDIPVVAEALRQTAGQSGVPAPGPFKISELVARIDAYRRRKDKGPAAVLPAEPAVPQEFSFETDENGTVRWVSGVAREPLIGLSLDLAAPLIASRVDGVAAGAFRRRAAFNGARLVVEGESDASGSWRVAGTPLFDDRTGRFAGYRCRARRPRPDERAEHAAAARSASIDSLRQLVHELRTPANAIAGFAEMIETQLLGGVAEPYRQRAAIIRNQARDLLGAIEDLDTAARIDAQALDWRPSRVALKPLLTRLSHDLSPLAELRGCTLVIDPFVPDIEIAGDERAVDRLFGRLVAAVVSAGENGERIDLRVATENDAMVAISIDRPKALAGLGIEAMFAIDPESELGGGPLLGIGFALRLARNLASQLGGGLSAGVERLTLRLPTAVDQDVGQASSN